MNVGGIMERIDVAQLVLYIFWGFFAYLIYYLRREDKREGYPLETDAKRNVRVVGFPDMPSPKVFILRTGGTTSVPANRPDPREIRAVPVAPWPGAPLEPTGDGMIDGVGPASYSNRADVPDVTFEGALKIVPLRVATDFAVAHGDPEPRGMAVVGSDGTVGGTVLDIWIDRSEPQIRYLEVTVTGSSRRVLLPMTLAKVDAGAREIRVASVKGRHFATVPVTRNPDAVTLREEDQISAYFAGGHLYGDEARMGPIL